MLITESCPTLCDPVVCPWDSLGKNIGVGSYSLLQGIFPALGSNLGFLYCRQILCHLSHTPHLLFEESLVSSCQILNKAGERGRRGFFYLLLHIPEIFVFFIFIIIQKIHFLLNFFWFQYGPRNQKNFKEKCTFEIITKMKNKKISGM